MATLEIEIGMDEQARLQREAQTAGLSLNEWTRRQLFGAEPARRERETLLVTEYQALVECERQGRLSEALAERRRQVEMELDALEAQDPYEQMMNRRLQETSNKLEEVLELLRRLPKKEIGMKDIGQ